MSKKNSMIDYLLRIDGYNIMIKNRNMQRQQMFDIACSTTAKTKSIIVDGKLHNMEKVKSSGSNQQMADALNEYVDLETDVYGVLDLIKRRDAIIKNIEKLNITEYDVLHKMYVQNKDLNQVASECGKSYSWAASIHGRALKSLQKILEKEGKDGHKKLNTN